MPDCRDKLELKFGRRDLLDTLNEARGRIIEGKTEAILLIELGDEESGFSRTFAWKDDMKLRWVRFIAAVGSAYHELYADGLVDPSTGR